MLRPNRSLAARLSRFLLPLAAALALAPIAGCGGSEPTPPAKPPSPKSGSKAAEQAGPKKGGTKRAFMVVGVPGDAKTLDPSMADDTESGQINELIYETLVRFKKESLEIEPCLAESWSISEDGKTWTFKIRQSVKFHDGSALDADDVVGSVLRQMDDQHPHHRAGKMPYATAFFTEPVESVKKTGDYEVVFQLKEPFVSFLANLACDASSIVSMDALEKHGEKFEENPVGTGAYKLKSWTHGSEIVLEGFDDYWEEPVETKTLFFKVYAEPAQRVNALLIDDAQLITSIDPRFISEIEENPDLQVFRSPALSISYLELNHAKAPYDNKLFRQALNYAVDKEYLVEGLMKGQGYISVGGLPPGMEGSLKQRVYPYNPEKAKQLLKESGVDLEKFTMEFKTYDRPRPYNPVGRQLADACAQDFQKVGIKVRMDLVEFTKYIDDRNAGAFEVGNIGWGSDNGQADNTIFELFGKPDNRNRYVNAEANELMRQAMVERDDAKRAALYEKANQSIVDDAAAVWLNHGMQLMAGRKTVGGFKLHPKGTHKFEYAYDER